MPILLATAAAVLIFGTDHPNGQWKDRFKPFHDAESGRQIIAEGDEAQEEEKVASVKEVSSEDEEKTKQGRDGATYKGTAAVEVDETGTLFRIAPLILAFLTDLCTALSIGVTLNQNTTLNVAAQVLMSPVTWLPTLAYISGYCTFCMCIWSMPMTLFSDIWV